MRRYSNSNRQGHKHQVKQSGVKGMFGRLSLAVIILVISTVSLLSTVKSTTGPSSRSKISILLLVDGDCHIFQDLICPLLQLKPMAIYKFIIIAALLNNEVCGFHGVYGVEHFIKSLRYDVRIVESILDIKKNGKTKKIKAFQPPRDAPISWYTTDALQKIKEHGAIYLTPFSHRLADEIDSPEYQWLRCRVNYYALRFKPHIMELSNSVVNRLQAQGHFMAIHFHFEMDMLAFAGCFDIFTAEEQKVLKKYQKENFAPKKLVYSERQAIGKCSLTPEEIALEYLDIMTAVCRKTAVLVSLACEPHNKVGLILRAIGFDNSTKIYLAAGGLLGGERFMKPLRSFFPRLENHNTVDSTGELAKDTRDPVGFAVDYMICLSSDIFTPTYDKTSNLGFLPSGTIIPV